MNEPTVTVNLMRADKAGVTYVRCADPVGGRVRYLRPSDPEYGAALEEIRRVEASPPSTHMRLTRDGEAEPVLDEPKLSLPLSRFLQLLDRI